MNINLRIMVTNFKFTRKVRKKMGDSLTEKAKLIKNIKKEDALTSSLLYK